jgi:hypothetical protein
MSSLAEPHRCARDKRCAGYDPDKNQSAKPPRYNKGDFCNQCQRQHAGGYRTSSNDRWMDEAIKDIETVFAQRPAPQHPRKATLWDLFSLDSSNGGWKKYSDRGAVLMRLDAKTLRKLRDWLEEHKQEAIEHYDEHRYKHLHNNVSLFAAFSSLPPDKPLLPEEAGTDSWFDAVAHYTKRGTSRDLTLPIRAAARAEELRQERRHITEREIEQTI